MLDLILMSDVLAFFFNHGAHKYIFPLFMHIKKVSSGLFFFLMGIMVDQESKLGIIQEALSKLIDSIKEKATIQETIRKCKHFCWGCCGNAAK